MTVEKLNVLLLGSGAREHTIAWKITPSPLLALLYCAPGNPGMKEFGICVDLDILDPNAVCQFCIAHGIDLVVIGPEEPMFRGVTAVLRANGIKVFGFSEAHARLESDKVFAKEHMLDWGVPTPRFRVAYTAEEALHFSREFGFPEKPVFWKAFGSAAGKGAYPVGNEAERDVAARDLFELKRFGDQSIPVLVEEAEPGDEKSFFGLWDGRRLRMIAADVQDYKRRNNGDKGLNTGGMGAVSPSKGMSLEILSGMTERIFEPSEKGMSRDGFDTPGVVFFGAVETKKGPMLYEYNVRFGDPETQALLLRFKGDLLAALLATVNGELHKVNFSIDLRPALGVVITAPDYPADNGRVAGEIRGVEEAGKHCLVFQAGTKMVDGKLIGGKGRVLTLAVIADTVEEAWEKIKRAIACLEFENGMHYRTDIGL